MLISARIEFFVFDSLTAAAAAAAEAEVEEEAAPIAPETELSTELNDEADDEDVGFLELATFVTFKLGDSKTTWTVC